MPTKSVQKSATKKKPTMKKTLAAKPKLKLVPKGLAKQAAPKKVNAKKSLAKKSMAKKQATASSQRGFMWRLLEQRKAAQNEKHATHSDAKLTAFERLRAQNSTGFSRFQGPRRKP